MRIKFRLLLAASALSISVVASAQTPPVTAVTGADDIEAEEIIVTAERIAGSVETDVPPVDVLDEVALESLGASTLTEVLEAIGTQTRSGGRGGGQPIILVNGRRISGFSEIRDLPPEAIQRVEIFPEEVALRYGFAADQRVTNFILKKDFMAFTGEAELGAPTRGGRLSSELQTTFVNITGPTRVNLSAEYEREGAILESERGIVQPGVDTAPFRTLSGRSEELQLNGVLSRPLTDQVGLTLNLRLDDSNSDSLSGVPIAQLPLIGTGAAIDPLTRDSDTRAYRGGLSMNGPLGSFQWTLTANLDHVRSRSEIERDSGGAGPTRIDRFASNLTTASAVQTFTGPLFQLPAGPASLTARFGFEQRDFTSRADTLAGITSANLDRGEGSGRLNIELPIASRRRAVLDGLGDLSLNANIGYRELTDFGGLWTYGYGGTWSPVKGLTLLATYKAEDAAPSPEQLGNPVTITPNVTVFDFVRGESVIVSEISGGNPFLRADERRDLKLGATYSPPELQQLSVETNYFRVRSRDPISGFPALTAATEAAFPDRIVRDATGRLVSIDTRSVNYLATRSDTIRSGISFSKSSRREGGEAGAGPRGPRPQGTGRPPGGGGGRGGGGGGGMFGGGGGKRWNLALYHSFKLKDEVQIAAGLPVIDLLNGGAIESNGGSPRHVIDLEGGWFDNGLGMRLFGTYQSGTTVEGGPGATDLDFSPLFTLNARFFVNFDQRKGLIEDVPFLKGSRLQLRVDNIFDSAIKVRDDNGAVPFRYQRGFVNPVGRSFVLSFRKLF